MNNTINDIIADRETIAKVFNTDELTTHRILMNINWGFFKHHFKDDADNKWNEAHPFYYPNHKSINYTLFSINFIKNHFDLFAKTQFVLFAGTWELNKTTNKMVWTVKSDFITVD